MAEPPSVTITAPDTATRGQSIGFSANATDNDGDTIASYAWDFGDGATGSGQSVSHAYTGAAGAKHVTVTVTDSANEQSTATHDVTVQNTLPVADINRLIAPEAAGPCGGGGQNPAVPLVGQQIAFSGADSTDPDGSLDTNTTEGIRSYGWDLDGDSAFDDGTGQSVPGSFSTAGMKTVSLRVTDSDDAAAQQSDTFRVNTPPAPSFLNDPTTPVTNEQITFGSTSSDADIGLPGVSEQLSYAWDFDDDGFDDGTSQNTTHAFSTPGMKNVRLCVRDTGGIARMFTKQILVQSTVPAGDFTFSPGSPLPGQAVTFTSTSTPTSGKQLTGWEWDFDFDGSTFTPDATGASVSHSFASSGSKNVALKVTEAEPGGGGQGFDIVSHTISVNAPPQAGFTVSPASGIVGQTVTLASTSADPDGPLIRQDWDLDNDGQYDDANAAVVSATFKQARTYMIKLRVTDSKGATDTETKSVVVKRAPLKELKFRLQLQSQHARIRILRVTATKGARVKVRCSGKPCPKSASRLSKGRPLRFKKFERRYRPGTKLTITTSKSGYLTEQRTIRIRRGKTPKQRLTCLPPGAKHGRRCPT
jgi:PKD repeat protein